MTIYETGFCKFPSFGSCLNLLPKNVANCENFQMLLNYHFQQGQWCWVLGFVVQPSEKGYIFSLFDLVITQIYLIIREKYLNWNLKPGKKKIDWKNYISLSTIVSGFSISLFGLADPYASSNITVLWGYASPTLLRNISSHELYDYFLDSHLSQITSVVPCTLQNDWTWRSLWFFQLYNSTSGWLKIKQKFPDIHKQIH